jgi:hypothetical protein
MEKDNSPLRIAHDQPRKEHRMKTSLSSRLTTIGLVVILAACAALLALANTLLSNI